MLSLSPKYSIITLAFEFDYETKFNQFMFLFNKTELKRRIIGRCKAKNGFNFFLCFLTNFTYTIGLVTPIKWYIDLA